MDGRTDGRADGHLRPALLGQLGEVDLIMIIIIINVIAVVSAVVVLTLTEFLRCLGTNCQGKNNCYYKYYSAAIITRVMKHILRLVNYYKNILLTITTNIFTFDVWVSIRDRNVKGKNVGCDI